MEFRYLLDIPDTPRQEPWCAASRDCPMISRTRGFPPRTALAPLVGYAATRAAQRGSKPRHCCECVERIPHQRHGAVNHQPWPEMGTIVAVATHADFDHCLSSEEIACGEQTGCRQVLDVVLRRGDEATDRQGRHGAIHRESPSM